MMSVNVVSAPMRSVVPRASIEVECDVQVRAPGHRDERPLVPEHLHRIGERARFEQMASGDCALHQRVPAR
jgi:hypothetical protein